ncbi:MAG TPA: ABC transporter permease [Vicinamibacterales bacterium]
MSRWRRIWTVAVFEFLAAVKRRGYMIATFGMPVFMGLYGVVVGLPAYYAGKAADEPALYGVVDRSGLLQFSGDAKAAEQMPDELRQTMEAAGQKAALDRIRDDNITFRSYADEAAARGALMERTVKGYYVIAPDYVQSGKIDNYSPESARLSMSESRNALSNILRERLLAGRVDGTIAARVLTPVGDMRRFAITRTGEVVDAGARATMVRIIVPVAFMVLFLMSVLMTSGYLMQGTATEKENKVVDVLLASARPDEVLAGKLVGLGGAGLLQVTVWLSFLLVGGVGIVPLVLATHVQVPWLGLALALPLFITSFLFFGSLMLGTGSLGTNMREAQQLAMVWSLTAALPLMMMALILQDPHGIAARVMTWVPFTSAAIVMLRASLDPGALAWWEIAGSFVVLALSTRVAIGLGARLFRLGLLSSGSRPSFRQIITQARLG